MVMSYRHAHMPSFYRTATLNQKTKNSDAKAKKRSPVSGHRSASKSMPVMSFFSAIFFYLPTGKYVIHCIHGDQISHLQSMVAKRGLTNRANVRITSRLKHSTAESSNFGCNWTSFHSPASPPPKKKNVCGHQKPET